MNYEIADDAKYLYAFWIVLWVGIYVINAWIYKYYQEKEEQKYSYYDDNSSAPATSLLFTLWWKIEDKENSKIQRLKKTVNRLSVCFGGFTVLSIAVAIVLQQMLGK
ncbi:MAG: hypothetical protein ACXVNM_03680 [Bacteroidia bacterium]